MCAPATARGAVLPPAHAALSCRMTRSHRSDTPRSGPRGEPKVHATIIVRHKHWSLHEIRTIRQHENHSPTQLGIGGPPAWITEPPSCDVGENVG